MLTFCERYCETCILFCVKQFKLYYVYDKCYINKMYYDYVFLYTHLQFIGCQQSYFFSILQYRHGPCIYCVDIVKLHSLLYYESTLFSSLFSLWIKMLLFFNILKINNFLCIFQYIVIKYCFIILWIHRQVDERSVFTLFTYETSIFFLLFINPCQSVKQRGTLTLLNLCNQ